jgi:hypothetical protein
MVLSMVSVQKYQFMFLNIFRVTVILTEIKIILVMATKQNKAKQSKGEKTTTTTTTTTTTAAAAAITMTTVVVVTTTTTTTTTDNGDVDENSSF